jgi:ubiquinone/menaquinone biosynthesis C-methylase UbiE
MIDTCLSPYEDVAPEYYDEARHPTCANFHEASALIIRNWITRLNKPEGRLLEVGAGKSLLAEFVDLVSPYAELIITDSSSSMLSYSSNLANPKVKFLLSDARALPFASDKLDLVVSSLGDPYNVPQFWSEVYRVLRPGKWGFFTTPSYDWSTSFRHGKNGHNTVAEFELLKGGSVFVASWIYSHSEQVRMIEKTGLYVEESVQVPLSALRVTPISPKLLPSRGLHHAVIDGYVVMKPTV